MPGTVVEMNVPRTGVVDPSQDIFKIADMTHLVVWAYAYEHDLPVLRSLPRPIPWVVKVTADPADPNSRDRVLNSPGAYEVGPIIDPNQHTALVIGKVDNADRRPPGRPVRHRVHPRAPRVRHGGVPAAPSTKAAPWRGALLRPARSEHAAIHDEARRCGPAAPGPGLRSIRAAGRRGRRQGEIRLSPRRRPRGHGKRGDPQIDARRLAGPTKGGEIRLVHSRNPIRPSFPSSAWERTSAKLRFASRRGTGLEAELRGAFPSRAWERGERGEWTTNTDCERQSIMVRYLISWALSSPLIVLLLGVAAGLGGAYAFLNVNVEAYPDPPSHHRGHRPVPRRLRRRGRAAGDHPARSRPGRDASSPDHAHSLPGRTLPHAQPVRLQHRLLRRPPEALNRFQSVQGLPPGVQPQISPATPTGGLIRYTVDSPRRGGRDIYSLTDQKSLEDWTLEKAFKLIPGIIDVDSFGGETKQYLVAPDPTSSSSTESRCRSSRTPSATATPTPGPATSTRAKRCRTSASSAPSAAAATPCRTC